MPEWLAETPWWVVAGLTITLAIALFKAARWTASTDKRLDSLETIVKEIRGDIKRIFQDQKEVCDDIKRMFQDQKEVRGDIKRMFQDQKEVRGDIKRMFQDQKEVRGDIKRIFQDQKEVRDDIKRIFQDQTVEAKSPIELTNFGKKIADQIKAYDWSEKFAPGIVDKTIGKEEFEIFEICVDHISEKYNDDIDFQKVVRANAYQHGTNVENVLKVQQVSLRDCLLEKFKT